MDREEIFAACTSMRLETADWLDTLDDQQLDTQSLCADWRVRDVAGHLVAAVTVSVRSALVDLVKVGFSPDRVNTRLARRFADSPAGPLRERAAEQLTMPFVGAHGPFTDLIVHNADMRVPLDAPWQPDPALSAEALRFVAGGQVGFTPKKRVVGLRVVATDTGDTVGEGDELSGTAYDLLLALCGRRVGLETLSGPGVEVLRSRI